MFKLEDFRLLLSESDRFDWFSSFFLSSAGILDEELESLSESEESDDELLLELLSDFLLFLLSESSLL